MTSHTMRTFLFGVITGVAGYHYISGGFNNDELVKDLRGAIQKLDDRLAEKDAEKDDSSVVPPTVVDPQP